MLHNDMTVKSTKICNIIIMSLTVSLSLSVMLRQTVQLLMEASSQCAAFIPNVSVYI